MQLHGHKHSTKTSFGSQALPGSPKPASVFLTCGAKAREKACYKALSKLEALVTTAVTTEATATCYEWHGS